MINGRNNTALLEVARVSGVDSQACFSEVVHTLLTSGADVNAIGENGWSVLHCLALNPNPRLRVPQQRDVARHLIQHGARPDVQDSSGRLALHHAVDTGHLHLLCALADAAPGLITAQAWGAELLSAAAKAGRRDIVQVLLRRNGADGPLMVTRVVQVLGSGCEGHGVQLRLQLDGALVELEMRQAHLRLEQHLQQHQQAHTMQPSAPPLPASLYPGVAETQQQEHAKHTLHWGAAGGAAPTTAAGVIVTGVPVSAPPLYPQLTPSPYGTCAWLQQEVVRLEARVAQLQSELREHEHRCEMLAAAQQQAEAAQRQAVAAEAAAQLARERRDRDLAHEAQKAAAQAFGAGHGAAREHRACDAAAHDRRQQHPARRHG
ncbi:hypothetical protein CHLRE_02g114350v5 [Chlamydomonas reinhardtii]|uniref:Uncharacterized protein n=1 Tax=Chlamydomonas reinhardtii TaxID=3055 RepID=A0A2K3E374_CHLRE|nr:uncharacterized protein CHLRE_02g114350v5 [Chlamydomonas reinhardtii]PNW87234.1 hypothetical protein CHLRE_02g114350v5 [Chlamydomonas reinhardtii]